MVHKNKITSIITLKNDIADIYIKLNLKSDEIDILTIISSIYLEPNRDLNKITIDFLKLI